MSLYPYDITLSVCIPIDKLCASSRSTSRRFERRLFSPFLPDARKGSVTECLLPINNGLYDNHYRIILQVQHFMHIYIYTYIHTSIYVCIYIYIIYMYNGINIVSWIIRPLANTSGNPHILEKKGHPDQSASSRSIKRLDRCKQTEWYHHPAEKFGLTTINDP